MEATDKTYSGLGVGLYIVNEIVKRHQGRVKVVSTVGRGTTFTLILPNAKS